MNDMLMMSEILQDNQKNLTFREARRDLQEQGFDVENLKEFSNYKYGWDSTINRFIIVDYSEKNENGYYLSVSDSNKEIHNPNDIFLIAHSRDDFDNDFSWTLADDFEFNDNYVLEITSGLDTGIHEIDEIIYNETRSGDLNGSFTINTTYYKTKLIINSKSNTNIVHRGFSKEVIFNEPVARESSENTFSYTEHGLVSNLYMDSGVLNLEAGSQVFNLFTDDNFELINIMGKEPFKNPSSHQSHSRDNSFLLFDLKKVYRLCSYCGLALTYNGDTLSTNTDSIGWLQLYFDNLSYNKLCKHEHFENQGTEDYTEEGKRITIDTCSNCHFFYFTDNASHKYTATIEGDVIKYSCECGWPDHQSYNPRANVDELSDEIKEQLFENEMGVLYINPEDIGNPGSVLDNSYGTISDYNCGYNFGCVETEETIAVSPHNGWLADFIISFNRDVSPYELALWGSFGVDDMTLAFTPNFTITKGQKFPLLTSVLGTDLAMSLVNYTAVANIKNFMCGAMYFGDNYVGGPELEGDPLQITVELCLMNLNVFNDDKYKEYLEGNPSDILYNEDFLSDENYFVTCNNFPHIFDKNISDKLTLTHSY